MGFTKGFDYTGIAVVFFCHDGKGNFVMHKRGPNARDERNVWDVGGGALEFGETIEESLAKEIKEEFGADILDTEFLGYRDVHRTLEGKKTHWLALDFKVLVDREQVKNNEPHKFDEIGWFTLDTLPHPMHSQTDPYFKIYKEKFKWT